MKVTFEDLGAFDYKECWDYQEEIFKSIIDQKISNRKAEAKDQVVPENRLLFVEHPHVFTLGKSGSEENLLATPAILKEKSATYYKINRGGDITYHGPGQIVGYPLFDLDQFFTDIHKYLRYLEEAIINTIAHYGVKGGRIEGLTGVWIDGDNPEKARKIAAMGVKCSRWVTMHGFAFNVNTDLSYFDLIIPCGIDDKAVTSLERETGSKMNYQEVSLRLQAELQKLFGYELI